MYENELHLYPESNVPSRFESKMRSVVINEDYLGQKYEERIENSALCVDVPRRYLAERLTRKYISLKNPRAVRGHILFNNNNV